MGLMVLLNILVSIQEIDLFTVIHGFGGQGKVKNQEYGVRRASCGMQLTSIALGHIYSSLLHK